MARDKQLAVKNALKECNERAGAHIKKYVQNNEVCFVLYRIMWNLLIDSFLQSRSRWLPTYLAECKVKLGVTTEEPAFLTKVLELYTM